MGLRVKAEDAEMKTPLDLANYYKNIEVKCIMEHHIEKKKIEAARKQEQKKQKERALKEKQEKARK